MIRAIIVAVFSFSAFGSPLVAQVALQATGGTIQSLTVNGFTISGKQTVAVWDHTAGLGRYLAAPASVSIGQPDASTIEFDVTLSPNTDITSLEIDLPKLSVGTVTGMSNTGSQYAGSGDLGIIQASWQGGEWFVVDENEISGTIVNPCSSQFMLRMGSSNGGAMPVTANSSHVWKAGETYALRFAYRFAAAGSDLYAVNKLDVLEWVQTVQAAVPVRTDHRPIISLFLSQTGSLIDPNTVASKFSGAIQSAQQTNSGGIVVWDVEGTKYASYTGDPRIIPAVNPASLPALDQAFANARAAGLSVGVCIRDCYIMTPDKSDRVYPGAHNFVPRPYANETERRLDLFSKIAWSIDRWQITRVYLDSWAGTNDTLLFLAQSFPDVIISPETQYPGPLMYAITQPYIAADRFRTQTPASIKAYLLNASGWEYIGNVSLTSDRLGGIYAGAAGGDILGWRGVTDWPDGEIISEAESRGYW